MRPGKPQENGRHERMHRTLKSGSGISDPFFYETTTEIF
nr:hypothetical protein [Leptospira weilii]